MAIQYLIVLLLVASGHIDIVNGHSERSSGDDLVVCPRIYTEGFTEQVTGYAVHSGVYNLQKETFNDFPVFKHEYRDVFIFYQSQVLWFGKEVGRNLGFGVQTEGLGDKDWVVEDSGKAYPFEEFKKSWISYGYDGLSIIEPSAIKLRCVTEEFHMCSSGKMYFNKTLYQEQSNGNNITLNVAETYLYQLLPGIQKNARPVYKLNFQTFVGYLFYDADYGEWVAGPDYNGNKAYISVISSEFNPGYIDGTWRLFENEEFSEIPEMALKCRQDELDGVCSGDNRPCQNGGRCTQLDGGHVFCSCGPKYSGTTCEVSLPQCPPISDQHGRTHVQEYVTAGTAPGDLTAFFCMPEYTPNYFLSSCVVSADGATSEWTDFGQCVKPPPTTTSTPGLSSTVTVRETSSPRLTPEPDSVTEELFELTTPSGAASLTLSACAIAWWPFYLANY